MKILFLTNILIDLIIFLYTSDFHARGKLEASEISMQQLQVEARRGLEYPWPRACLNIRGRGSLVQVYYRALRAVLEIGNSSIFEQFRAVFTDFCSKMLSSNIVKLLEIARNLLEINHLLEIARITKKCSKL